MNRVLEAKLNRYEKKRKAWKKRLAVIVSLCAVVAGGTSYMLINNATAQVKPTYCGYEEHLEHTDDCYEKLLICGYPDGGDLSALSGASGQVSAESGASVNDASQPSSEFQSGESGQAGSEAAAQPLSGTYVTKKVLSCGKEETAGHTHTAECYGTEEYYTCGLEETAGHTHTADCYLTESVLSCGLEETAGHTHGDGCYAAESVLTCTDQSVEQILVCGNSDADHVHTESCYEYKIHEHTPACYETRTTLVCQQQEYPAHYHGDGCYTVNQTLTCNLSETPAHTHDDSCRATREVLVCGKEEAPAHMHDDSCYTLETVLEEPEQGSGSGGHKHTKECYQINYNNLVCTLPIHEHVLQCFSNPEADRETAEVWERTFERVELTGNWNEDVLAIAKTQLGYTESALNYEVLEDGTTMNGYTRYGDWYGYPYGDWCAMFCSFCMNYAEVDRDLIPFDHGCRTWIDQLSDPLLGYDLYRSAEDYIPVPGDLVFFDLESFDPEHPELRDADHVGFVAELEYDGTTNELKKIKTIEGNFANTVTINTYDWNDSRFLGYGVLPQNPEYEPPVEEELLNAEPTAVPEGDTTGTPEEEQKTEELVKIKQTIESQPASDGAVAVISGMLPEGAQATIQAVALSPEELFAYFGPEKAALMTGYVAYDIKIMVNGEEWQPDSTVSVTVKQTELRLDGTDHLGLAHIEEATNTVKDVEVQTVDTQIAQEKEVAFSITEEMSVAPVQESVAPVQESVVTTQEPVTVSDVDVSVNGTDEVSFETDGFSVFILYTTFTVDFYYNGAEYHMDGLEAMRLSALFAELGIPASAAEVQNAVFSDPSLMYVAPLGDGDWLLSSLAAFSTNETLTVTLYDGTELVIDTTDANITATIEATWDDDNNKLSSVVIKASSTANTNFNYDVYNGSTWTIGAGDWYGKFQSKDIDITSVVNNQPNLNIKYRGRCAENTGNPENDKSAKSKKEYSLYDILDTVKAGFTEWVSGAYTELFGGTRPTTVEELYTAFDQYYGLPSLTLEKSFNNSILTVTASTDADFEPKTYVWEYYDEAEQRWVELTGEAEAVLNATKYSELSDDPAAEPLLDGGKTVRCKLYNGEVLKAVASLDNVNPLQEIYEGAIGEINTGLGLNAYSWYLNGVQKTASVQIGTPAFMDYFYYDNVARDPDVPFRDGESYKNYLASQYLAVKETEGQPAALAHVAAIWDKYIFDIYNPNPGAGVVGNYSYYPGANTKVDPDRISTYGDKIIEWPKDNASSFHNPTTGVNRYGPDGLINALSYDFLEGGVDYSRFIQSLDKTATADAAGDFNEERTYDIDITAKTQATSVSPLAMLITVQTSWQMFDYPHANCVAGDGTYTSIEVGGAQHNTEMANLYDIKQAILRFVDWMDENFPGHNLVLGINEVQHGGSYNLINYNVGGGGKNGNNIIYVSNNSDLLRESLYNWDTFGNCEHVHYDTDAMEDAAKALEANLTGWVDINEDPIQYSDINKVAVIIGGGTENTNGTNGYGCALPWGTFYSSDIDAVYGIRTNVGTPLNTDGVLSWLDYYKNNTGNPYSLASGAGYSSGSATGKFTEKYVAPSEDAVFNYLVKIAQQELKSKGIKVQDESKSIENVTVSDTVNDEFRIEENKPFAAAVFDKNGNKVYETVITPTAYDAGAITNATATFTVYNSDGTVKSTETPAVEVEQDGTETTLSVSVDIPYSYVPAGAEAIPQSGTVSYTQKLSINQNSDNTTDVSYDFGTVYNTNDAKLHFEVIARDDYIGSNNVFTNEGTPEVSFRHVKLDRDGNAYIDPNTGERVIVSDKVDGYDTPEVNVPIRFTADNGGSITVEVKTPVNLEDLSTTPGGTMPDGAEDIVDSEYITATVHDLIDNYDQINGTVSYTWVIPGGKEYPVPVTLHVTDGDPDGDITAASEMAQKWTPKTPGTYDVVLKVTFTPDPVEDKGNFANDGGVTATRVTKLDQEGHETVIVTSGSGGTEQTTELTVSKVWSGEKGNTGNRPGSITFNVFQDGEFYDQKSVTSNDEWRWTFTNLPYYASDVPGKICDYTITEDNVPNYMTAYGDMQKIFPPAYYWVEVPLSEVDLDGGTEYLIVDKSTGVGINADSNNKTPEVDLHTHSDGEYPAAVDDDALSYIPDDGYLGWNIKYTDGTANTSNYIKSASTDTTLYLKKDGSYAGATGNDTCLKDALTDSKIHLSDKFLKIAVKDGTYSLSNDGKVNNASAFSFYEKVDNTTAPPTYRTTVTNTYIPGGERPNETSVTVTKEWVIIGDGSEDPEEISFPEITIHLLRNGKEIDSCTLNNSTGWTHTFSTLPGTDTKLPYFDPLTGETYDYTVTEDVVSGYETGYKRTLVSDPNGGTHWILFNESSVPGSTQLWDSTAYALVTPLTTGKGDKAVTKDYVIGSSGSGFNNTGASIRTADDPNTTETETFTFGSLACSKELTSSVPANAIWSIEPHTDPKGHAAYYLKVNGQYVGLNDKNLVLSSTTLETNKKLRFHWNFSYTGSGSGKFYVLAGDNYDQNKYLTLKLNDKGNLEAGVDGDAGKAAAFTVFEQVSLQSKFDTYSYEVQNIPTSGSSTDGNVECKKYIDYLIDNIEETSTENPDTALQGEYYRLYLDAVGTRDEDSEGYPEFKGVRITDHLSQYVKLADNGSSAALSVDKVSVSDPDNSTPLWSGNLNTATGSIGTALGNGASVIKSVVYTRAGDDETDTTGQIIVEFQPEYCLEEGYRYVISYNVEATDLAKKSSYPSGIEGDPGTDYPNNFTSSEKPGFHANSFADIVYTQDDEIKIGIYPHPVIQVNKKTDILLRKVDATSLYTHLAGAEFDLYLQCENTETGAVEISGTSGKYGRKINADPIVSSKNDVEIKDLEFGQYYLIETKAPNGYTQLTSPVGFVLRAEGIEVDLSSQILAYPDSDDTLCLFVKNSSGYELPKTGGTGAFPIYTLGALLTAGALMYGYLRRRRERRAE